MPYHSSLYNSSARYLTSRIALTLVAVLLACASRDASAQSTAKERLREAMGSNIETFSILGSDRSMSSGSYESKLFPESTLDITRLPIRWESNSRYDILGLDVAPVFRTGLAWGEADRTFRTDPLFGDRVTYESLIFNLGLGGRVHLTDNFSITPSFDIVYGQTEQAFTARSDAGRVLDRDYSGELVNWDSDSLTYAPKLDIEYQKTFGAVDFHYTLSLGYYETDVISGDGDFESDSTTIANTIGVEVPLGFSLFEWPLRSEIDFTRIDSSGGIENSLRTDSFYQANVSLITRETKRFPLLTKIGIDGGYTWADSFDGYSFGITGTFDFDRFMTWFN
jgi:hypothetical protein